MFPIHIVHSCYNHVIHDITVTMDICVCVDGPAFQEGNNVTKWVEFVTGSNFSLNCTVNQANPPTFNLTSSNTSSLTNNSYVTINASSIQFIFSNGQPQNRGHYTCNATGPHASTSLTYLMFVGGMYN